MSRDWRPGDTVEIRMPFSLRIERALDRPDTQAVFWGPVLLQVMGDPGGGAFRELSLYRHLKRDGDYGRAAVTAGAVTAAGDPTFTAGGLALRPYYISDGQAASARAAGGTRNGASASSVTTHGETVVAKLFARKGPSGWYSHVCMSRADQSLTRQSPKMASSAS